MAVAGLASIHPITPTSNTLTFLTSSKHMHKILLFALLSKKNVVYYHQRVFAAAATTKGALPLWNPYQRRRCLLWTPPPKGVPPSGLPFFEGAAGMLLCEAFGDKQVAPYL